MNNMLFTLLQADVAAEAVAAQDLNLSLIDMAFKGCDTNSIFLITPYIIHFSPTHHRAWGRIVLYLL